MKMLSLALLGCFVLSSCADKASSVTRSRVKDESSLMDKYASTNPNYEKGKKGEGKKSEFAGKSFTGPNDFSGRSYAKKDYTSKRWGGNTKYNRKSYNGKTDASRYKRSPDFVQRQAEYSNRISNAQGKNFGTRNFDSKTAREQSGRKLKNVINQYSERDNLGTPIIMTKSEKAKLSIDETNSALGR